MTATTQAMPRQRGHWAMPPKDALLVTRWYCTGCAWEAVQHCRLPDAGVRIYGLEGPVKEGSVCTCGQPVWIDVRRA